MGADHGRPHGRPVPSPTDEDSRPSRPRPTGSPSVYLDRDRLGGGGGRALHTALLEGLARRGYRTALAGMTLPNAASEGFHKAMGFVAAGRYRRVGWKHGAWHDVAWMQRPLAEGAADPPAEPEEPDRAAPRRP